METVTAFDTYFQRIGYTGSAEPTVDNLHAIVAAHNRTIPFENLDPLVGRPVYDLGPEALTDKLVTRSRGGYCYEHNGLLRHVLRDMGFEADALAGRVVWMAADDTLPAQTHNVLSVGVPGVDGRLLTDVGFGGQTLSSPIRLEVDVVQETRHEPYRLREHPNGNEPGYQLEALVRDKWQALYMFGTRPQPLIDLQVGSWYVSTHPESTFVVGLTAARVTDDARWNMRGRNRAVHANGSTEKTRFDTAAEVCHALTDRFGIDLSGLGDVEARVAEVLDT